MLEEDRKRRAWLLTAALASAVVQLPICSADQSVVDVDDLSEAGDFLRAKFDAKATDAYLDSFKDDASVLNWALSNQSAFSTPLGGQPGGGRVVSVDPFVTVFEDFLTPEECEFLKTFAQKRLKPAQVVLSGDNWFGDQQQTRNNEQNWLKPEEERNIPLLRHIMKRMHRIARVPDEYAEALQIGRYNVSNKYEGHLDSDPASSVGRPATLIAYLADVESGGDTLFPVSRKDCSSQWRTDPKTGEKVYGAQLCCNSPELDEKDTVRVRPKMGRAVLFFNHFPHGQINRKTTHIGCTVNEGVKWIAQRWFRWVPYNKVSYRDHGGWDDRFDANVKLPEERAATRHLRVLSKESPRLFLEEHFLSSEEIAELSKLVQSHLGESDLDEVELSSDDVESNPLLQELSERAHDLGRMPPDVQAPLKLKRIRTAGSEGPRMDSPPSAEVQKALGWGSQIATIAAYIRVPEQGGELAFLETKELREDPACAGGSAKSCCALGHLQSKKVGLGKFAGDAVMWYSYSQEGKLDLSSSHVICPVVEGEIWIAEWGFMTKPMKVPPEGKDGKNNTQPSIDFLNMDDVVYDILWVSPQGGEEVSMGKLQETPSSKALDTFAGHVFHIRDEAGGLVHQVTATAKPRQRIEIRRKTEL